MDLHPYQLHAHAAAWSLHDARRQLADAVADERYSLWREASTVARAASLQAWRPMVGRGSGAHGDPVARAAVGSLEPTVGTGRLDRLAASTTETLVWLVSRIGPVGSQHDPLGLLINAVPWVDVWVAAQLALWFGELDLTIRTRLSLSYAEQLLAGLACPSCGVRRLVALTAGPHVSVVCRAGCKCAGPSCRCGMPIRAAGVAHIWSAGSDMADRAREALTA